jgi:hypothetical protein
MIFEAEGIDEDMLGEEFEEEKSERPDIHEKQEKIEKSVQQPIKHSADTPKIKNGTTVNDKEKARKTQEAMEDIEELVFGAKAYMKKVFETIQKIGLSIA